MAEVAQRIVAPSFVRTRLRAFDRTSRGAIAQSVERFAAAGVALVISVVAARRLTPLDFGYFSLVTSSVALLVPICTLGLVGTLVNQMVRDESRSLGWMARAMAVRIAVGTLIGLALLAALLGGWLARESAVLIIVPPLLGLTTSFHAFEARSDLVRLAWIRVVGSVVALVVLVVAWFRPSPGLFALAFITMYVVPGVVAHRWVMRGQSSYERVQWSEMRPLVQRSLPLIISTVGLVLNLRIDQIMIAWLDDVTAVGPYAIATNFSESLTFVAAAIAASHAAGLTRAHVLDGADVAGDARHYDREVGLMYRKLRRSGVATTVFSVVVGCAAIPLLYGPRYLAAIPILLVHSVGSFWYGLRQGVSRQLIVEDLIWLSVYSQLLAAAVNIVLNLFMIPWLSGLGAAISTLVSYFATGALMIFTRSGRHIGWRFLGFSGRRALTPSHQETA
ncbi:MAG: oligosaccharide flippase family protein [Ilumatobacteraceae bacterium]